MDTLAEATLAETERRVLDRFVELLRAEPGLEVRSVWLHRSRARGEQPQEESDVDLLVVTTVPRSAVESRLHDLVWEAAEAEGASPMLFSLTVWDEVARAPAGGPILLRASGRPRQGRSLRRAVSLRSAEFMGRFAAMSEENLYAKTHPGRWRSCWELAVTVPE